MEEECVCVSTERLREMGGMRDRQLAAARAYRDVRSTCALCALQEQGRKRDGGSTALLWVEEESVGQMSTEGEGGYGCGTKGGCERERGGQRQPTSDSNS
jgi:hypothetical protein